MNADWKRFWLFCGLFLYGIAIINAVGGYGSSDYINTAIYFFLLVIGSALVAWILIPKN
jgi:hypothetical protein